MAERENNLHDGWPGQGPRDDAFFYWGATLKKQSFATHSYISVGIVVWPQLLADPLRQLQGSGRGCNGRSRSFHHRGGIM